MNGSNRAGILTVRICSYQVGTTGAGSLLNVAAGRQVYIWADIADSSRRTMVPI